MNSFLANALGLANTLLAVILILGGALLFGNAGFGGFNGFQALLGLVGGLVVAVIVCGLLAILVEIRRELVKIRSALETR